MKKIFCLLILGHFALFTQAQHTWYYAFTNNVTSLPFTGYPQIFYANLHPGLDAAYSKQLNQNVKHRLMLRGIATIYYHRFVQTLITAAPQVAYEHSFGKGHFADIGLGVGGCLSFEQEGTLKLNSEGVYERRTPFVPRPQYVIQLQAGYSYALSRERPDGARVKAGFRTTMQGTFAKSYVPLLPVNTFYVGVQLPLSTKTNAR